MRGNSSFSKTKYINDNTIHTKRVQEKIGLGFGNHSKEVRKKPRKEMTNKKGEHTLQQKSSLMFFQKVEFSCKSINLRKELSNHEKDCYFITWHTKHKQPKKKDFYTNNTCIRILDSSTHF